MKLYKSDLTFLHIFHILHISIGTFFFFENKSTLKKKSNLRKQIKSEKKKIPGEKRLEMIQAKTELLLILNSNKACQWMSITGL